MSTSNRLALSLASLYVLQMKGTIMLAPASLDAPCHAQDLAVNLKFIPRR